MLISLLPLMQEARRFNPSGRLGAHSADSVQRLSGNRNIALFQFKIQTSWISDKDSSFLVNDGLFIF